MSNVLWEDTFLIRVVIVEVWMMLSPIVPRSVRVRHVRFGIIFHLSAARFLDVTTLRSVTNARLEGSKALEMAK